MNMHHKKWYTDKVTLLKVGERFIPLENKKQLYLLHGNKVQNPKLNFTPGNTHNLHRGYSKINLPRKIWRRTSGAASRKSGICSGRRSRRRRNRWSTNSSSPTSPPPILHQSKREKKTRISIIQLVANWAAHSWRQSDTLCRVRSLFNLKCDSLLSLTSEHQQCKPESHSHIGCFKILLRERFEIPHQKIDWRF